MNILLSKNDTVRFGEMTLKKRTWGGFDVCALMFINIAKAYPEHTFYFYGCGDSKHTDNIFPKNLINLTKLVTSNIKRQLHYKFKKPLYHYNDIYKYIDSIGLKLDKAIIWFCRPTPFAEFEAGYISKRSGEERIMLMEEILQSPPLSLVKHYNIPTVYIIDDLMEINRLSKDLPKPYAIYSQFNGIDKSKHYTSLTDIEIRETPVIYKQIEKLWLQGKKKVDWRNFKKDNKFILTVNAGPYKAQYIKKWVINKMPDTIIYGNWNVNKTYINDTKNVGIDIDNQCKNIGMSEIEDLMFRTRYTFVIPAHPSNRKGINRQFVTQKVYSMIYYGIIPFWCSDDYDTSNIYKDIPDFIKVKTVEEFYEKMNILDNDTKLYNELKNTLYNLLEDKYFNQDFIHEIYDSFINDKEN